MRFSLIILFSLLSINVYSQMNVLVDEFPLSDNLNQLVYRPAIAAAPDGNFAVSWADERNGQHTGGGVGQIFATIYDINGNPVTENFHVDNIQYGVGYQQFWLYSSSPVFMPNGNLAIAWHVDAYGYINHDLYYNDIYYSAFTNKGVKLVDGVQLNRLNNLSSGYCRRPYSVFVPPTTYAVTYDYSLDDVPNIGCTLIDASTGNLLSESFVINDIGRNARSYPTGASNGTQTVMTWTDTRNEDSGDIYMQRFVNGQPAGSNIKVNNNEAGYNSFSRIAMNSKGNFVIVWIDGRDNVTGDLFAQIYNPDGNPVGNNIKLTSSSSIFLEYTPGAVMFEDGSFAAAWSDSTAGGRFTCKTRLFEAEGTPLTPITELTSSYENSSSAQVDLQSSADGILYFTWLDGRDKNKGRIYAKILSVNPAGIDSKDKTPTSFSLLQNYPNPFNPETVISYQLSVFSHTVLKVYDLLGNEVATLVNREQNPGSYKVKFDGSNLPSGVYLYQLIAGNNRAVKKFILLK